MIDIHCHILAGIDDGAQNFRDSVEMASMAANDGIETIVCTPHVKYPEYQNSGDDIAKRVENLQAALDSESISLKLHVGADVHIDLDLTSKLASGRSPCINETKYFLLEPNHTILTPNLDRYCSRLLDDGFVPILTHPERLAWVRSNFELVKHLRKMGVLMQITANSLDGAFGRRSKDLALRMLNEQIVDVVATDAHNTTSRPPILSKARTFLEREYGERLATKLVYGNPLTILSNGKI